MRATGPRTPEPTHIHAGRLTKSEPPALHISMPMLIPRSALRWRTASAACPGLHDTRRTRSWRCTSELLPSIEQARDRRNIFP